MKRPAIFFDRDNTLIVSDGYLGDPARVVLIEGAADAVAQARLLGFATVVVSNQSGVARGMFSEDDVRAVNRKIDQMLLDANPAAVVDRHEYCPYLPDASIEAYRQDSDLRKPRPGMLLAAADKLALDLSRSWIIGDAPRDIEAGKAAGCRAILLHLPDLPSSPAAAANLAAAPDCIVSSLKEALDYIAQESSPAKPPPTESATSSAPSPQPALRLAMTDPPPDNAPPGAAALAKLEHLAEQILLELRKRNEQSAFSDFSLSKLMAGIAQVVALAMLFIAYLNHADPTTFDELILCAIFVQTLTLALLIMGRQR